MCNCEMHNENAKFELKKQIWDNYRITCRQGLLVLSPWSRTSPPCSFFGCFGRSRRWRPRCVHLLLLPNLFRFRLWFWFSGFILLDLFGLFVLLLPLVLCWARPPFGTDHLNLLVSLITIESAFYLPSQELEVDLAWSHVNDRVSGVEERPSQDEGNVFIGSHV